MTTTPTPSASGRTVTYTNPVWPHYFADPFVLRVGKTYYAYGTGPADGGGRQFPVLRSDDLVNWQQVGHAIEPVPGSNPTSYWAPEVAEHEGKFYLYYSCSTTASDADQRLRVAVADSPEGPFVDSGKPLMPDLGFSIDAHPFHDPRTGRWYLFFAMDFTDDEPHGTGLAVVPLEDDLVTVTEKPERIVRASSPWQVFEFNRNYKDRVWPAWHCVEGPFVLYRDGKYYCLYSGGAWHSTNYGIGYAVADHPAGPYVDEMAAKGPSVLTGTPEKVVGPGHNSVVLGPDNHTLFVVYHAWDPGHTARRMCIDPLIWDTHGPRCDGPSSEPRTIGVW